jgi:hypothetical protein
METAMSGGATHTMWVQRYDITDPAQPDTYVAKVWCPPNTLVYQHHELLGVVHRVEDVPACSLIAAIVAE